MTVPTLTYPITDSDTFSGGARAGTNGWSPASSGSNWAVATGTGTIAVASNEGTITGISSLQVMNLGSSTLKDGEVVVRWDSSANAAEVSCHLRSNSSGNTRYYFRSKASVQFLAKDIAGTVTQLGSSGSFTTVNSTFYWFRFRVVGVNLFGKIWADGSSEPAAWTCTANDSAITAAGNFGVGCNPTGTGQIISYDNFNASSITAQVLGNRHRVTGRFV